MKYENGTIKIDDVDLDDNIYKWQSLIGFVSQDIFLINDTIIKNIAFGISPDQIDETKVSKCLDIANLSEFINTLPDGLNTVVGERGIRLSGGQLQRVGIARALYNEPEILIFDEATSALDNETENQILESIQSLKGDKTIIMISHKIDNLGFFDKVFVLGNGSVIETKSN